MTLLNKSVRLKNEEFLEDKADVCMKRFKQHQEFEVVELKEICFYGTTIPKLILGLKCAKGIFYFEEWDKGAFAKTFEVIS